MSERKSMGSEMDTVGGLSQHNGSRSKMREYSGRWSIFSPLSLRLPGSPVWILGRGYTWKLEEAVDIHWEVALSQALHQHAQFLRYIGMVASVMTFSYVTFRYVTLVILW